VKVPRRMAETDQLREITILFRRLNVSSLEDTLDWLRNNFAECPIRDSLIEFLSREEIILKEKFYHNKRESVIFYFTVYNKKTKRRSNKRISLGIPKNVVTSPKVKRGFESNIYYPYSIVLTNSNRYNRNKDGYELIENESEFESE
jgi:hypothetical protein